MGRVFLADDTVLDREVAIKTIRPSRLEGDGATTVIRRFEREARLAARLRHPNLPEIYDASERNADSLYLVMEFVKGVDLQAPIDEKTPLNSREVAAIGMQTASALDAIHHGHIVHRDLKPANLRLNEMGVVKLVDFGIAADRDSRATRLTHTGNEPGTPDYQAPEFLTGGQATPATDLYALGVVLYELLRGAKIFGDGRLTVYETQRAHAEEIPEPLSHPELNVLIVEELLAKDPSNRPATAGDVYRRLGEIFPSTPLSTCTLDVDPSIPLVMPLTPPTAVKDVNSSSGRQAPVQARPSNTLEEDLQRLFREAEGYFRTEDWKQAVQSYRVLARRLAQSDPHAELRAQIRIAEALAQLGHREQALQGIDTLLRRASKSEVIGPEGYFEVRLVRCDLLYPTIGDTAARADMQALYEEALPVLGSQHDVVRGVRQRMNRSDW